MSREPPGTTDPHIAPCAGEVAGREASDTIITHTFDFRESINARC